MGFESLLGNERVKQNLRSTLNRGRATHFYLISGPEGSGKHTLARLLSAAILCKGQDRPCCTCSACRKVLAGSHPDVITVDDPEKKIVPVRVVRDAISDIYIRPNEGSHKIYLLPRGQDMEDPSQNALLKVLEEPPPYGVILLLTTNAEAILPTVRSRCVELRLRDVSPQQLLPWLQQRFPQADEQTLRSAMERSGGYPGQAVTLLEEGLSLLPQTTEFLQVYASRDSVGILQVLASLEKTKRDQLEQTLEQWQLVLESALVFRSGGEPATPMAQKLGSARNPRELMHAIRCLKQACLYLARNVSPAAVCGWLTFALQ